MPNSSRFIPSLLSCLLGIALIPTMSLAQSVEMSSDQIQLLDENGSIVFKTAPNPSASAFTHVGGYLQVLSAGQLPAVILTPTGRISAGGGMSEVSGSLFLGGAGPFPLFTTKVELSGATGTATNSLNGNGFVKGWAKIDQDGTVLSCYNCDPDPVKTFKQGPGIYFVDFSPIDDDISSRPALATINGSTQTTISTAADAGDPSRVEVFTSADAQFTVMVF